MRPSKNPNVQEITQMIHKPDPLGRRGQLPRTPDNRWRIEFVCQWVRDETREAFYKKPDVNHVYYEATWLLNGRETAQTEFETAYAKWARKLLNK